MSHESTPTDGTPETPAENSEDFKLYVDGFEGTPEEIERQWLEKVYKGRGDSMPQLTWRAVIMGSILGGVLSLTNLYIGLKSGWGFGVAITACILSYAIWTSLHGMGIAKTKMTILENNCMQSTASAAGYSTGTTLVSAFPAYILITGAPLPLGLTMVWVFFMAVLGVTMAIPMKRQMINIEQLRFPSGVAAAETLKALHSHGRKGMRAAKALGLAGLLAALDNFWAGGLEVVDGLVKKWFHGATHLAEWSSGALINKVQRLLVGKEAFALWKGRTAVFSWDAIFVAAGAISGMRVCLSMLVSGTLCWAVYVPILQHHGYISTEGGFRNVVPWTLWGGVACMVSSGILSFLFQWRTSLRAFRNLGNLFRRGGHGEDPMDALEAPTQWFLIGQVVSLVVLACLAKLTFNIPYWVAALALVLSFILALVACRVTGETDTTPLSPISQLTQMIVGTVHPGSATTTLMSANIVSGASISSADLLTDLKSGYLLGANPRKQFIAQFSGIFIGTLVSVLAFSVIIRKASDLGSDQFPAPSAQIWSAVARTMNKGIGELHTIQRAAIEIGLAAGVVLAVLPLLFPKQQKYLPSAAGVGLAWTFHWYYSMLFFLGAFSGWIWKKASPQSAEDFTFPVASGIIAGGALMGVFLIFVENGPEMVTKLFGG
ncbi:MAG TPA: OPT family oligopeptide transporter [Candidatus Acidoferrum sp.]|jgi:putative OPT family oligopeptide transporter|nr:OPT family oligopeptide transporter [Candidatus Acidoferrum sp.]